MFTFFIGGGSFTDVVVISTNQQNYNLYSAMGSPATPRNVRVVINPGVTIDSSTTSTAAFDTGNFPAGSLIRIENNGNIIGKGGKGGDGGDAYESSNNGFAQNGEVGEAGGKAMNLREDITLDNTNGNIFGGGGGGGGGGGACYSATGSSWGCFGGGGGGGGAGDNGGAGGAFGNAYNGDLVNVDGANGSSGGATGGSGGLGGQAGGTTPNPRATGGDGGEYGQAGGAATQPVFQQLFNEKVYGTSRAGGAGGQAIDLNGNSVTWLGGNNGTQVKGAVS